LFIVIAQHTADIAKIAERASGR